MSKVEIPYRGRFRKIEWVGGNTKADKSILQGGEFLIPFCEWGDLSEIQGEDPDVLTSPIMQKAYLRVLDTHIKGRDIALFSLCTATRPYSSSRKWKKYIETFEKECDLIICSNGGIIPIEYEAQFPYLNYDAHGQKKHDSLYIKIGIERMKQFLTLHPYRFVIFNFRHTLRNVHIAEVVSKWAVEHGYIQNFIILPTKAQYVQSQGEGFTRKGYSIYPELWPTMFNPLVEKVKEWGEIIQKEVLYDN